MVRTVQLSDGTSIPSLAWGNMGGKEKARQAGAMALKAGIHHIDTAQIYYTEAQVIEAIKDAGMKREDVYVTTKRELLRNRSDGSLTTSLQLARLVIARLDNSSKSDQQTPQSSTRLSASKNR
jgi:diketogulonate reductase-like aldo/keto reductase